MDKANSNNRKIKKGIYRHYKGDDVRVVDVAEHTETGKLFVAYYHNKSETGEIILWVRPLEMFQENVTINGVEQPRFRFLKEN